MLGASCIPENLRNSLAVFPVELLPEMATWTPYFVTSFELKYFARSNRDKTSISSLSKGKSSSKFDSEYCLIVTVLFFGCTYTRARAYINTYACACAIFRKYLTLIITTQIISNIERARVRK